MELKLERGWWVSMLTPNCGKLLGHAVCAWREVQCTREGKMKVRADESQTPATGTSREGLLCSLPSPHFLTMPLAAAMLCVAAPSKCQPGCRWLGGLPEFGCTLELVRVVQPYTLLSHHLPLLSGLHPHPNNHGLGSYKKRRQPLFPRREA